MLRTHTLKFNLINGTFCGMCSEPEKTRNLRHLIENTSALASNFRLHFLQRLRRPGGLRRRQLPTGALLRHPRAGLRGLDRVLGVPGGRDFVSHPRG